MTKTIPGSRSNPQNIPHEGYGGSNTRGAQQGWQRCPEAAAREEIMSSTGNRSNPNKARIAGHGDKRSP